MWGQATLRQTGQGCTRRPCPQGLLGHPRGRLRTGGQEEALATVPGADLGRLSPALRRRPQGQEGLGRLSQKWSQDSSSPVPTQTYVLSPKAPAPLPGSHTHSSLPIRMETGQQREQQQEVSGLYPQLKLHQPLWAHPGRAFSTRLSRPEGFSPRGGRLRAAGMAMLGIQQDWTQDKEERQAPRNCSALSVARLTEPTAAPRRETSANKSPCKTPCSAAAQPHHACLGARSSFCFLLRLRTVPDRNHPLLSSLRVTPSPPNNLSCWPRSSPVPGGPSGQSGQNCKQPPAPRPGQ